MLACGLCIAACKKKGSSGHKTERLLEPLLKDHPFFVFSCLVLLSPQSPSPKPAAKLSCVRIETQDPDSRWLPPDPIGNNSTEFL